MRRENFFNQRIKLEKFIHYQKINIIPLNSYEKTFDRNYEEKIKKQFLKTKKHYFSIFGNKSLNTDTHKQL